MSIILLGFKATGDPEEDDTQFQLTGLDAWRVIRLVEPFESRRTNPVVFVTIYSEDLTGENCNANFEATRGDSRQRQHEIFDNEGLR